MYPDKHTDGDIHGWMCPIYKSPDVGRGQSWNISGYSDNYMTLCQAVTGYYWMVSYYGIALKMYYGTINNRFIGKKQLAKWPQLL